ncbi:MAG: hypothetical protein RML45_03250 [Acetobacteraceae bacterium]|nr:hypothetical protein [Acetobacteraceae bacterium]
MEPLLREWQRLGLASGIFAGPDEAQSWAAGLRHQMACAAGLPAEALWHGPRGRDRSWVLKLSAFIAADGAVAEDALRRAAASAVFALDIAGPQPPARIATVVAADLAGALMAAGIPYAWPEGRATSAALLALLLGGATEASAALALRLGPCPAWSGVRSAVLRALEAAAAALPPGAEPSLERAARAALERGFAAARRSGLRVLGLVAFRPPGPVESLLGAASAGGAPVSSLLRFDDDASGRPRRRLIAQARRLIAAQGLSPEQELEVVAHIAGRGTFSGAPRAALDRLVALGILPERVEPHLAGAVSLAHAVALSCPGIALPGGDVLLAALERYAIGTGSADEAPFLAPRVRAALAEGADDAARAAMERSLAPFLRLGLAAAREAAGRRRPRAAVG